MPRTRTYTYTCAKCGKEKTVTYNGSKQRKCIDCYMEEIRQGGEKAPAFISGVLACPTGTGAEYERALIEPTHDKRSRGVSPKYRNMSCLMAEQALGRSLRPDEVLFRLNGDSLDCSPENLLLTTKRQVIRYNRTGRQPSGCTLAELRPDWRSR